MELALEKTRQSEPFVEEARHLRALTADVKTPAELWGIAEIRPALLTAAGLSEKAKSHITAKEQFSAFAQMSREALEPQGEDFADELVYRFLLTRGDTLGGKMRNMGGKLAKRKFVNRIAAAVRLRGGDAGGVAANAEGTKFVSWQFGGRARTLALDVTVPQTKTNVDAVLLSCLPGEKTQALRDGKKHAALGELKGGIDPAGADEHWKTASHALGRIRAAFAENRKPPGLFFVGASIERRMAEEIYAQLQSGDIAFAANLTSDEQLSAICKWLVNL